MADRSSRPHRSRSRTPPPVVRKIVHLRWRKRLGPVEIGARLGMPASTVHAVLVRCRLNRLSHVDRRTGEPIRRYEHDHPGALLHVDVKKLGNIPDGGGWRYVGRGQGDRNRVGHRRAAPATATRAPQTRSIGTAFVHTVIDDHSRVAYAEIHDDETAATAIGVLRRAVAWFAARGVTVERVLSDNGSRLPIPRLARHLHRTRHHARSRPGPTGPRPTARSNASTAPWPTAGPSPAVLHLRNSPPRGPAQPGCTSTTTTGPTPPSARSRPSPA